MCGESSIVGPGSKAKYQVLIDSLKERGTLHAQSRRGTERNAMVGLCRALNERG